MVIKKTTYDGVIVPMITPFNNDEKVDYESAGTITRLLIDHGCTPFILGTTGESVSIPLSQRKLFVASVVEAANRKKPVYVGIASNCLEESIRMANDFFLAGADFAVAHLPFYYSLKPYQMKLYYQRLADSIDLPLLLYNISATTHMSIPLDVIFELAEHPNIIGIKDSEKNMDRHEKTINFCTEQDKFSHFAGWGAKCMYSLSIGSNGIVPSTGNLVPGLYRQLYDAVKLGEMETAQNLQKETDAISAIYQKGRNLSESLAALKVMMNKVGLCGKNVLPPLFQLSSDDERQILSDMETMNVEEKSRVK